MVGMTAAQICTQARQIAKVPGYASQSGQLLNMILADLCQTYDLGVQRKSYYFNMNTAAQATAGQTAVGAGPFNLPSDFLRVQDDRSVFYTVSNVPYTMVPLSQAEYDATVQQAGLNAYPYWYYIDVSLSDAAQQGGSTPQMWVYPPPSSNFPVTMRYFAQQPDIDTPETSATVPWFPNQTYLITRLAGELMKLSDDARWQAFLGEGPEGAQGILNRYLKLKDDQASRSNTVTLDRRRFGTKYSRLPNTKTIGW